MNARAIRLSTRGIRTATVLLAVGALVGGLAGGMLVCRWATTSGWGHRLPLATLPERAADRAVHGPGSCWTLDLAGPNLARWQTEIEGLWGRLEVFAPKSDGAPSTQTKVAGEALGEAERGVRPHDRSEVILRGDLQPVDVEETIRLTITARATPPRTLSVMATQSFGRFENLGFSGSLSLGDEWSTQSLDWVAQDYEPNPALHLFAGDEPGVVEFREIRVEAIPGE